MVPEIFEFKISKLKLWESVTFNVRLTIMKLPHKSTLVFIQRKVATTLGKSFRLYQMSGDNSHPVLTQICSVLKYNPWFIVYFQCIILLSVLSNLQNYYCPASTNQITVLLTEWWAANRNCQDLTKNQDFIYGFYFLDFVFHGFDWVGYKDHSLVSSNKQEVQCYSAFLKRNGDKRASRLVSFYISYHNKGKPNMVVKERQKTGRR